MPDRVVHLAEVCSEVRYGYTASATDADTGVRFLRVTDVAREQIDWSTVPFCEISESELERYRLRTGDIVIARMGTIGVSAIVIDPPPAVPASYLIRHRVDETKADARFISYVLRSPSYWEFVSGHGASGSVQPNINAKVLGAFEFLLPSLTKQRAVAAVLGSLDDKLEQNRQTARTLERLARVIFRAWFLDFEPVKAKAKGATSFPSMPQDVFDALPTRFVESDIGPVPEGWEVKAATEVATVAIGKTPPRKETHWFSVDPADVRWVSIRDIGLAGTFISETSEYLTEDAVANCRVRRIPDQSILFSFKLTVGRVAITDGEMTSNEAIAHFIPHCTNRLGTEYLYCYLSDFDHSTLGSTSSIATATNSKAVKAMPVIAPPDLMSQAFTSIVRPHFQLLRQLGRESRSLAAMRDYLLPKLLNRQVGAEASNA